MNKKGFTTVEVIVSFMMLSVILTSLITFSIRYRKRVEIERGKSEVIDFKNTMTKIVYDDIINGKYTKIEYCQDNQKCVNFLDNEGNTYELSYIKEDKDYLVYQNIKYPLPDDSYLKGDFNLKNSLGISHLVITIFNSKIDYDDTITLTIN